MSHSEGDTKFVFLCSHILVREYQMGLKLTI